MKTQTVLIYTAAGVGVAAPVGWFFYRKQQQRRFMDLVQRSTAYASVVADGRLRDTPEQLAQQYVPMFSTTGAEAAYAKFLASLPAEPKEKLLDLNQAGPRAMLAFDAMLGVEPGATSAAIDAGLDEAEKFAVDKTAQAQSYAVSIAKEGVSWYRWLTGT